METSLGVRTRPAGEAAPGPPAAALPAPPADRLTCGRHDQVALGETSPGGRAVLGYLADEQALGVGQADGAPEPPGDVAGGDGDAKPRRCRRLPAGQRLDPAAQRLVGGYG